MTDICPCRATHGGSAPGEGIWGMWKSNSPFRVDIVLTSHFILVAHCARGYAPDERTPHGCALTSEPKTR